MTADEMCAAASALRMRSLTKSAAIWLLLAFVTVPKPSLNSPPPRSRPELAVHSSSEYSTPPRMCLQGTNAEGVDQRAGKHIVMGWVHAHKC